MNYYQFHIGDFRSGTVNMSRLSRWIYRDMLDVYYDTERPLSNDLDELCNEIGVESEDERQIVQRLLRFKFTKSDDGYHNAICDRVIAEYHQKAETAKANGKLGGRPPKPKANQEKPSGFQSGSDQVATANRLAPQSEANQEPLTINQKPKTNSNHSSIASTDVVEVFAYWCSVMGSPKSKLDDKRHALISKALKLGYTIEQIKASIDGCARTPYNMGLNDRNTKYNSLGLILRDADHIERFMSTPAGAANGQPNQSQLAGGRGVDTHRPKSAVERVRENAARERASLAAAQSGGSHQPVGADVRDVRPQVDEPVFGRDRSGERVGRLLEGDFERADQERLEPVRETGAPVAAVGT